MHGENLAYRRNGGVMAALYQLAECNGNKYLVMKISENDYQSIENSAWRNGEMVS